MTIHPALYLLLGALVLGVVGVPAALAAGV